MPAQAPPGQQWIWGGSEGWILVPLHPAPEVRAPFGGSFRRLSGYGGLRLPPSMRREVPCYWEGVHAGVLRKIAEEADGETGWREHFLDSWLTGAACELGIGLPGTREELLGMGNAQFLAAIRPLLCRIPPPALPETEPPGRGIPPGTPGPGTLACAHHGRLG